MSAMQSIGKIMPVDSFAPKAIAMYGTMSSMKPCAPVFDMPIHNVDKARIDPCKTDKVSVIFNLISRRVSLISMQNYANSLK